MTVTVEIFRHEALFYSGEHDFLEGAGQFILDGLDADEPTLAVLSAGKIGLVREWLGRDDGRVHFADMDDVGRNPARIIPAWRAFVDQQRASGHRFRGIGEPIWATRTPEELVECERHESLLNLAFDGAPAWWLLCPYDTKTLDPAVLHEARKNHPFLWEDGAHHASTAFTGLYPAGPFSSPLPEPDEPVEEMPFAMDRLPELRAFVCERAVRWGMQADRTDDLVLAVNELATNSLRYGGGRGRLRMWRTDNLVCEVIDQGRIEDPLVGREVPDPTRDGGFGLWLVNHLCDLVQIRSFATGSVVRLHVSFG